MSRWLMHDHAILRSTGFSWSLLSGLEYAATRRALDDLDDAERARADAVTAVVDAVRSDPDALDPRRSRRLRKALHRAAPVPADVPDGTGGPLADALDAYECRRSAAEDALERARRASEEDVVAVHRRVVALAADPSVAEAIWLSSPSMHDRGLAELARSADAPDRGRSRTLRRQVVGYLQRLAAKNETTSFFGPINYADFEDAPPDAPAGTPPRTAGHTTRSASLAYWAVLRLADAAAADPGVRRHLRPRRHPMLGGLGDGPARFADRAVRLDPELVALLLAADGTRTVGELARLLGRPEDAVHDDVEGAVARRLLVLDCRPPVTVVDALGRLRATLAAIPDAGAALAGVDRVGAALRRFETADLSGRRAELAVLEREVAAVSDGEPVRRAGGQWYGDRLVVHEEAAGDVGPLALGRPLQDALRRRLAPAMDLMAAEGVARHAALTASFLDDHPEVAQGRVVPLVRLLRAAWAAPTPVPDGPLTPAGRRLAELVAAADPDRPVVVDPARLPDVDLGPDPLVASPDLMFDAAEPADLPAGRGNLVLAECHDTMLLWGWALQFHPDPAAVRAEGTRLLDRARAGTVLASVLGSRRAKIVPFDFGGPVVDLAGAAPDGTTERIPVADVGVRLRGDRVVCTAPGREDFLLHHGELDSDVHNVLAPPRVRPLDLGGGDRRPRVVLGDVVVARARWRLDRDLLFPPGTRDVGELEALRHARRAAREHGVPRRGFLGVPGERKPVLLDLDVPALLDLGRHLSAGADRVQVTELLPGPDGSWLRGPHGRHPAELRTTMVLDRGRVG